MAKVHDIRKAFFEKGHSISKIAEEQGIDRKTVRKHINQDDWNEPVKKPPNRRPGILEAFKPIIDEWLNEDRRHRKKQRHTSKRVYDRLVGIRKAFHIRGKVERSHKTDKDEFYQLLTYTDDVDLNQKLQAWE